MVLTRREEYSSWTLADQVKLLSVHSFVIWLCAYLFGEESVSPDKLCKSFKPTTERNGRTIGMNGRGGRRRGRVEGGKGWGGEGRREGRDECQVNLMLAPPPSSGLWASPLLDGVQLHLSPVVLPVEHALGLPPVG